MFMRLTPANSHRKYDPGVNCRRFAKSQSDTLPAMMLAIIPAAATMRLEPVELTRPWRSRSVAHRTMCQAASGL